ncbi:glycosyltransferase family 2 protein [Romboutsia sp. Marseille-P6047]|uniref:glycosyltransferase family 2 protein n=1 Tax=Romboutsia sp. Marseille-P6047 TaxID=2161817 RepID=UPI000F06C70E|nr:cellulose synthase catalytic subunit [Romboutsia sp. Marseille-P6047]
MKIIYLYFSLSLGILILLFLIYPKVKSILYAISIILSFNYIVWRFSAVPTYGISKYIGIGLLIAEILGFIQFMLFVYISSRNPKEEFELLRKSQDENLPTVDIVIPTYNEPTYIIKTTIAAALDIKYDKDKKNIYVCDDGKRYEVKKLCEELNVHYSVRKDNTYSKSGNINNMLLHSNGDLIAVFDADMIPKSNFLEKTVTYFNDENVGFVQTPQSFYNADIFQKAFKRKIPAEQDFFMRDVQENRSYINSEIHVGTNAVFRRTALDAIGGYPTFSITEDIALGFLIQSKGYKSVFLNEPLALGLNPTNLKDFLVQRDRWCRGNLQLLKSKNPFKIKGLKLNQKIAYIDGLLSWYSSILKMIFIIAPIFYLLTGIFFIDAPIKDLLVMFVPYFAVQYSIFSVNSPNTRTMYWAHIYETIMAPYNAKSCFAHIFKKSNTKFKVTNKDVKSSAGNIYIKEAYPHIILIILTILSWLMGCYRVSTGELNLGIFGINILWTIYNVIPMFVLIRISLIKDYNEEPYTIVCEYIRLQLVEEDKLETEFSFKLIGISEDYLTLEQDNDRVLLKGEKLKLSLNGNVISGVIEKSTNGEAILQIDKISKDAYLNLINIYSDSLRPFYDLDRIVNKTDYIQQLMKGEIEY